MKNDSYERRLDNKNRLTVPLEVQEEFPGGVVIITKGYDDDSLNLFGQNYWDEVVESALQGDFADPENFRRNRLFRSTQIVSQLDSKQGRVVIEQRLLDMAKIKRDLTMFKVTTQGGRSYWALIPSQSS